MRMGQFILGGWAIFAQKIFRQRQKNCHVTLQNYFDLLSPPSNYYWALYLARQNEFRFFSFNKYIFFVFGCWFLREKFSLCP